MKVVLPKAGVKLPVPAATHSCKATLLSWAAKAGMSRSTRRLLGAHADTRDRSMLEYSRDALAGPLKELEELLQKINDKVFSPDVTRSGRWAAQGQREDSEEAGDEVGQATEGDDGSTNDEQEGVEKGEDLEAQVAFEAMTGQREEDLPEVPEAGIWINTRAPKTHVAHKAICSDVPVTLCGLALQCARAEFRTEWPSERVPLCRRGACFPREWLYGACIAKGIRRLGREASRTY